MANINRDWLTTIDTVIFGATVAILYDDSVGQRISIMFDDADISSNLVASTAHGLGTTYRVQLTQGSGALPSPLVAGQDYWIYAPDANNYGFCNSIQDARAGTIITLTPGSSTAHINNEQPIDSVLSSIEQAVAREVPNANSYARRAVSLTGAFDTGPDNRMELMDSNVQFGPASGAGIPYTGVAFLTQATTTYGSTTGRMYVAQPEGTTIVIPNLGTKTFTFETNLLNRLFTDQGA